MTFDRLGFSISGPLRHVLEGLDSSAPDGAIVLHAPEPFEVSEPDVEWYLTEIYQGDLLVPVVAVRNDDIGLGVWNVYYKEEDWDGPDGRLVPREVSWQVQQLGGGG